VLNGAEYEFFHHSPELLAAGGTQAQVDALRLIDNETADFSMFDSTEQQVIRLTFQMTRQIQVAPEVLGELQKQLGNTKVVELVGVIAAYNMVSRFLIALGVGPEEHPPTPASA
jgi:alkylhydroperoxidase family enzyme